MLQPGRKYEAESSYRYGFNGKENDNDVKGEGNQQDYGMRIYDPRLGRFLSVDPLSPKFPWYTPYQFAGNKPIWCIDLDGTEDLPYYWQMKERVAIDQAKTPEDWARLRRQEIKGRNIVVGFFFGIITFGYSASLLAVTTTATTAAATFTTTTAAINTVTWLANPGNQLLISSAAGFVFELLNPDPNGAPVNFPGEGDEFAKGVKWLFKTKAGKQVEFIAEEGARFVNQSEFNWAGKLLDEGNNVKVLKESTEHGVQTADLLVNGVRTEIKAISDVADATSDGISKAIKDRLSKATGQAKSVIIDLTGQKGATLEIAERGVLRYFGQSKGNMNEVRVVGDGFDKVIKNEKKSNL